MPIEIAGLLVCPVGDLPWLCVASASCMEIEEGKVKLTALSILAVLERRNAGRNGSTLDAEKALRIRDLCFLIDFQWQGSEDQGRETMAPLYLH